MFDFIFGVYATWYCAVVLFVVAMWFDNSEIDVLCSICTLAVLWWIKIHFAIPLADMGYYAIGYFAIGIVWSVYRWYKYCNETVQDYNERKKHAEERNQPGLIPSYSAFKNKLTPSENIGLISNWVISWPVSFLNNALSDFYGLVKSFISKFFIGVYNRISNSAIDRLN